MDMSRTTIAGLRGNGEERSEGENQGTGWIEEFVISRPTGCVSFTLVGLTER